MICEFCDGRCEGSYPICAACQILGRFIPERRTVSTEKSILKARTTPEVEEAMKASLYHPNPAFPLSSSQVHLALKIATGHTND